MNKQSKIRALVIGLLLSVAVGAPVASIVGNAPGATASYAAPAATETLRTEAVPTVDLAGLPYELQEMTIVGSPRRAAKPAKKADAAPSERSCRRVELEQQGIGLSSYVTVCEG